MKSQLLDIPLDLQELVCYSWLPVPPSLRTPDGFFNKTNKASMLHALVENSEEEIPFPRDAICIMDGNALFHSLTNLAPTMGGICKQILRAMVDKHDFMFSTDSYHEDSIKTHERIRRGISQKYGVLRKLKHIFPNIYQRINSICSPAKVGLVVTDFNYQPGS